MNFEHYERLLFERPASGVLLVRINRPEKLNAADARMKAELTQVWTDVDNDVETRVAIVTGVGRAFSAGGDMAKERTVAGDYRHVAHTFDEARQLVLNMLRCRKPIISAINGVAVGAGLAVALMSDISIMAADAKFTDGHMRMGVVAGDHSALAWPLLCGMAKAKYYLLTAEFIDGVEAERIGLVSRCVPANELLSEALRVAEVLSGYSPDALRWTKRALNAWYEQAQPLFDASLAMEMLTYFSPDMKEGVAAIMEKRPAAFPSIQSS